MVLATPPLPQISISLAPPEEIPAEPFSPFAWDPTVDNYDNDFRPKHLTPPPTNVHFKRPGGFEKPTVPVGRGLEKERFEALLRSTRDRSITATRKPENLRKEIALKAHKNKQVERRALFLSKVLAPPSPTATTMAKTPPESPAIFHFSLPSPGLVSPLALFESLNDKPSGPLTYAREPWVEQVDFQRIIKPQIVLESPIENKAPVPNLPSLDQISARLGHSRSSSAETNGRTSRLPAFLVHPPVEERPRLTIASGRLQLPVRSSKVAITKSPPVKAPAVPLSPQVVAKTTIVPQFSSSTAPRLSEANLLALNSRERMAKDMLSTLRRRVYHGTPELRVTSYDEDIALEEKKSRRHSAPADLSSECPRSGFEHPVLAMRGGF